MQIGPGGADASSAAQPAGDTWIDVQPSASSAPLLLDLPAAHHFCTSYRLDVRWQVEQSWGYWWGIPQSEAIDGVYKYCSMAAGVRYNYTWSNGSISYYKLDFAKREVVNLSKRVVFVGYDARSWRPPFKAGIKAASR